MDRGRTLNGFELNQQLAFDDQIRLERNLDSGAFENQWNGNLPFYKTSSFAKTGKHHGFIGRLKHARPKIPMNFKTAMHRYAGKAVNFVMGQHLGVLACEPTTPARLR